MGDRFREDFEQIDDILDSFDRRLDDLELRAASNLKNIVDLDDRAIELNDITQTSLNRVGDLPANILEEIMVKIIDSGLQIGRWVLDADVNGDFRVADTFRKGYYRMPKTSQSLTVVST